MNIYLLLILLVSALSQIQYRYKETINAFQSPVQIAFITQSVVAAVQNNKIVIYDIPNNKIQQQIPTTSPNPQLKTLLGQSVLYKQKQSLYQLKDIQQGYVVKFVKKLNYFLQVGLSNRYAIGHAIDSDNKKRVYFVSLNNGYKNEILVEGQNITDNIKGGSTVSIVGDTDYYLMSGGVCGTLVQSWINLYKGDYDSLDAYYKIPLRTCSMDTSVIKRWGLSSIKTQKYTYHLASYTQFQKYTPRLTTLAYIKQQNSQFTTTYIDVLKVLGSTIVQRGDEPFVYVADQSLCRVSVHNPERYLKKKSWKSILDNNQNIIFLNPSQTRMISADLQSNRFTLYGFNASNQIVELRQDQLAEGQINKHGQFLDDQYALLQCQMNELHLYNINENTFYDAKQKGVDQNIVDFCVASPTHLFILKKNQAKYSINYAQIIPLRNSQQYQLKITAIIQPDIPISNIKCLPDLHVLVVPQQQAQLITTFTIEADEFVDVATLVKNNQEQKQVNIVGNLIFFTNNDHSNTVIYLSPDLTKVDSQSLKLPPVQSYHSIIRSNKNSLIVALGNNELQYSTFDHYMVVGNTLRYMGSFPTYDIGPADQSNVIIRSSVNLVYVDYYGSNSLIAYPLYGVPTQTRGYFHDSDQFGKTCSGYSSAFFYKNEVEQNICMVIINGVNADIYLQKYGIEYFSTKDDLNLQQKIQLKGYRKSQLKIKLSSDKTKVLIYGIAVRQTLKYQLQVRNLFNLQQVLYEQIFAEDIGQNGLLGYDVSRFKIVTIDDKKDQGIQMNIQVSSGHKLPSGLSPNNIIGYQPCKICKVPFVVIARQSIDHFQIIDPAIGSTIQILRHQCAKNVALFSTSSYDEKIGYICDDLKLFIDDLSGLAVGCEIPHTLTQITKIQFTDTNNLLVLSDGNIVALKVNCSSASSNNKLNAGTVTQVVLNNEKQIYATLSSKSFSMNKFTGQNIQSISLKDNSTLTAINFDPNGQLWLTTATSLVAFTSQPCVGNYSNNKGYCECYLPNFQQVQSNCVCKDSYSLINKQCTCTVNQTQINVGETDSQCRCKPTFQKRGLDCSCSAFHFLSEGKCVCHQGSYYISETQCGQCSKMCNKCYGDGTFDCDQYSGSFIIIIVAVCVLVAGLIAAVVLYIVLKKRRQLASKDQSQKSQTSLKAPLNQNIVEKQTRKLSDQ